MDMRLDTSVEVQKEVCFGDVRYPFYVRNGASSWVDLRKALTSLEADGFFVVADSGIPAQSIAQTEDKLADVAPVSVLRVEAVETAKTLAKVDGLADQVIGRRATRQSVIIALGGGLVGNLAGLLAALVFRGIRLVHMPTTLMAMSDSTLSLKQGVNSRWGKNHIGAFYAPVLVWNHLDFLDSLPAEEIRSALCETIKNVLAIAPERCDDMVRMLRPDAQYSTADLVTFIELCVDAKVAVMANDHREKNRALVLEYGHTVGHAVELHSGGEVPHGLAIGLGMLAAARIARELGCLDAADEAMHRVLLERNGVPTRMPGGVTAEQLLRLVRLDNKRGYIPHRRGTCDFILLDGLGRPRWSGDTLITQVDEETVRVGIQSVLTPLTERGR